MHSAEKQCLNHIVLHFLALCCIELRGSCEFFLGLDHDFSPVVCVRTLCADMSRAFPSVHAVTDPDPEFVWNTWLSESTRALGLPAHCPTLLQVWACL